MSWVNCEEVDFNIFLFAERFQIKQMFRDGDSEEWFRNLGIALNHNPAVKWYFTLKCPDRAKFIEKVAADHAEKVSPEEVRKAEIFVMKDCCDFVTYAHPEYMLQTNGWWVMRESDKAHFFEVMDFKNKIVLDVGSGTGRLAFAAAEKAAWVYASEPVDTLREFMRDKIEREGIKNMRIVDGVVLNLPYPDDTFDIVMSGDVVGDEWDAEIAELTRVCKSGGWLLDFPSSGEDEDGANDELIERGWEAMGYYKHRKQIFK